MTYTSKLYDVLVNVSQTYDIPIDELAAKYLNNKNKRGRKKILKEEYIETVEYVYDGIVYLVDDNNTVYTNNLDSHQVIGEKLVDGSIKFYKTNSQNSK
jgi:hypothetical protein